MPFLMPLISLFFLNICVLTARTRPLLARAAAAGEVAAVSTVNELHADARQLNAVMVAQHDGAVIQRHAMDGGHV